MRLLRRVARRCEVHDVASRQRTRALEADLGMEPSDQGDDLVAAFANPLLVDCGHRWCEVRATLGRP